MIANIQVYQTGNIKAITAQDLQQNIIGTKLRKISIGRIGKRPVLMKSRRNTNREL